MSSSSTLASSRASGYRLLRMLFWQGVTPQLWPIVVEAGLWTGDSAEEPDFDEAAAAHQHLFGFNLFPHAAIFLEEEGLVGGEAATAAVELFGELEIPLPDSSVSADHIAFFLHGLSFLCRAEAEAWEYGQEKLAHQMQAFQQRLLHEGVVPWVWPLLATMALQEIPFYQALGRLAADMIADHVDQVPVSETDPLRRTAADLLDDEATTLRDIAQFLLTPRWSGWYLTKDAIEAAARTFELPRGFGGREQTLVNLLRAAGQYDQLPPLLAQLQKELTRWADTYAGWVVEYPSAAAAIEPWERRLAQTHALLLGMRPFLDNL